MPAQNLAAVVAAAAARHSASPLTASPALWQRVVDAALACPPTTGETSEKHIRRTGLVLARRFGAAPLTSLPDFWEGVALSVFEETTRAAR